MKLHAGKLCYQLKFYSQDKIFKKLTCHSDDVNRQISIQHFAIRHDLQKTNFVNFLSSVTGDTSVFIVIEISSSMNLKKKKEKKVFDAFL